VIKEAILKAVARENLSYECAEEVMHEIMEGKASEIQMAAYLTAMSVKDEHLSIRQRNEKSNNVRAALDNLKIVINIFICIFQRKWG